MHVLFGTVVFVAGILLGIRLLAGLYSVVDLWYMIDRAWRVVLRRVVGWTLATVVVLAVLDRVWRWIFLAGIVTHVLVYVAGTFIVVHTGARRPRPTPTVE